MIIHVVNPGDTIYSIAESYGIPIAKLVQDNDLLNPDSLVPGQTIIIVYPEQTYVVKEGDSLEDIAMAFHIPVMQLLRNNPQLANRNVVWFVDARTINSLMSLIELFDLSGTGIWNIMIFYTQMWLVINSQFEIIKLVDGNILKHPQDE